MHGSNELRLLLLGFCSKCAKAEHVSSAKLRATRNLMNT
jgi:hypothetical protein